LIIFAVTNAKYYSVLKSGVNTFYVQEGKSSQALAYADYDPDMLIKGWNKLFLKTLPQNSNSDMEIAFAAGYLEGALDIEGTWQTLLINTHGYTNSSVPSGILSWLQQNYDWTKQMATSKSEDPLYWTQVALILSQLDGVLKGHNDHASTDKQITLMDLLIINTAGDRETLNLFLGAQKEAGEIVGPQLFQKHIAESHCSCLIKLADDHSDLFTGHTTWDTFDTMLRTYKIYDLQYNNAISSKISFSSYPATLSSIDDFYVTSNGISSIETTNGVMNKTLLNFVKPQSVLSWIRVMMANQMGSSGFWWVETFKKYNSGTYNNQWIVTDFKQFEPHKPLKPGTLWIAEQIPGYIESADMTSFLEKNGYWPSYNIPYFPYIFNISGFPEYVQKYGAWFSYDGSPRAKIFKREQGTVNSIDSFKWMMRFNDWQTDPDSCGNAGNGISSRFDLVTLSNYTNPFLNKAAFGGIDSKVSSFYEYQNGMRAHAQSGPTYNQQVAFDWKLWPTVYHPGQPEKFIFDWQPYSFNE